MKGGATSQPGTPAQDRNAEWQLRLYVAGATAHEH